MAIRQIERIVDQSGRFGCSLVFGGDLADWSATLRSYELFAPVRHAPFRGPARAAERVLRLDPRDRPQFVNATIQAIDKSIEADAIERGRLVLPSITGQPRPGEHESRP